MALYDHQKNMEYILERSAYICSVAGIDDILPDGSNYREIRDAITAAPISTTTKNRLKYELRRLLFQVEMMRGLGVENV